MPDKGHMETEAVLRALEKRIAAEYSKANKEIAAKVEDYYSAYERKNKQWLQDLEDGKITEQEYRTWQTGQLMIGERWKEMRRSLAEDYSNTNDIAKQMAFDTMPEVYALNHNYATFEVEKGAKVDTSYTLYDRPTVERLIRDDPKLLPDPRPGSKLAKKLAKNKDLRWNEQHVQSAVLQSILQGESLDQTIDRFKQLTEMNHHAAVRYARTATTGAQNAGRVDGYKRAEKLGVDMKQVWLATLDGRTRHEHRVLDGQEASVGGFFEVAGFKLKYPGDPAAPAHLLFNCRCTVIAQVAGIDLKVSDKTERDDKIGDMTYEEWKGEHKTAPKPPENVPEGKAVEVKVSEPTKGEYKEEPIKPKFTPAKTKEEAEKYAHKFAKDVNYKGLSVENANQINEALTELTEKYPINQLDYIKQNGRGKAAMSACWQDLNINGKMLGSVLENNAANFKEQQEMTRRQIEDIKSRYADKAKMPPDIKRKVNNLENSLKFERWAVFDSYGDYVKSTVIHEYGHILADQYFGQINHGRANKNYITDYKLREMASKWDNALKKAKETGDIYKISRYGSTNSHEFFAECFVAREKGEMLPDYVESLMSEVLSNGIM